MDVERHDGKVVIVTGAGNGIGRATAFRFALEGAKVFACDVNEAAMDESKKIVDHESLDVTYVKCDVTKQEDVDALVKLAGPKIDVVANVAGIMDFFLPLGEMDDETFNRVMAVNVYGPMRLSRAVLPIMEKQGGGAIVTVASKASLGAGASGTAYTTSKHAVIGLVKSIAYYYGPKKIRSNAVLPGAVATAIGSTAMPKVQWAMERAQLSMATMPPTPAEPDQIATLISWLASEEASNVNGAVVSADGGWASA